MARTSSSRFPTQLFEPGKGGKSCAARYRNQKEKTVRKDRAPKHKMRSHGALSKENAAERNKLETNVGAECDAQIMVRAAGEIDFVAGVETKTDRAEMAFETGARVENAGEII